MNQFTSFTEQQPNFQINQTIAATESTSWIHKKHNVRFGGDFRRVHNDLFGNTGNITGTYTFTGFYTEAPGTSGTTGGASSTTGSSLADMLLGLPQQTSIQAPDQKSYLRQNAWDLFAQDSWRARNNLTLLAGLRGAFDPALLSSVLTWAFLMIGLEILILNLAKYFLSINSVSSLLDLIR